MLYPTELRALRLSVADGPASTARRRRWSRAVVGVTRQRVEHEERRQQQYHGRACHTVHVNSAKKANTGAKTAASIGHASCTMRRHEVGRLRGSGGNFTAALSAARERSPAN